MRFCARFHDHGQMLVLISEHRNFLTNGTTSRTWPASPVSLLGQSQKIQLETRRLSRLQPELPHFSQFALLFTGAGRPGDAVSDADESGGDVNATCTETASRHNLAPMRWIRDLSALLASISSFVRFLAFARLCHFESDPLRENLHSSSTSRSAFCVMFCREWSRCTQLCGRLWHPFPPQLSCRWGKCLRPSPPSRPALRSRAEQTFPGSFGASRSVTSCTLLRSLMPPVTVFRDCITVSWDGELPAACNSLRTVSHWLSVNSNFVLSRQGTG